MRERVLRAHDFDVMRVVNDDVEVLSDGTYDTIVIDAEQDERGVRVELTITAGPHKGEVVAVRTQGDALDPLAMLGIPARLVVTNGVPRVELER